MAGRSQMYTGLGTPPEAAVVDKAIDRLKAAIGAEKVVTSMHGRAMRASCPAPFPLHIWEEHVPDIVVLPKTTEDVVAVVKIANELKVPIVPRAGASDLCDLVVPLKKGIVLDVKSMDQVIEIDEENMCVTVQPGVNMWKLNELLGPLGLIFPDDPAGYYNAAIGGRIGAGGWSLLGMGYGHIHELLISMEYVLPTGEVVWIGPGGGAKKIRKSSVGYRFKELFTNTSGTLGVCTQAVLELWPKAEVVAPAFFGFHSFPEAHYAADTLSKSGLRTLSGVFTFDERKVEFLRRDDEAWIPQPKEIKAAAGAVLYGTTAEVEGAKERMYDIFEKCGGIYLGNEISELDWASRHDRYHLAMHGRDQSGNVVLMSWHCEDAGINSSEIVEVNRKWNAIAAKHLALPENDGIFDCWGSFSYVNSPLKGRGDWLTEIDWGIAELELTSESWARWVDIKREISLVTLEHGGTISACHGGTRPGDVELAVREELKEGSYELMKKIKRMLDPNNIMNPNKYLLDEAYED
ncbi:MAG: FAD-binding oxidoreductase [Thermoleophilia bacterium]